MSSFLQAIIKTTFLILIIASCNSDPTSPSEGDDDNSDDNNDEITEYICQPETESTDYSLYPLGQDDYPVGDVMPYYDQESETFYLHYLLDIWDDNTNDRHPWYGFATTNFYDYTELLAGELIGTSSNACDQDYAIGTGSVVFKDGTYYGFYTGHNPTFPSECIKTKEGVMLATSTSLSNAFSKREDFPTIFAPKNESYDLNDNFRDPFVYEVSESGLYYMIVSARKEINGEWKGVLAQFSSENLLNWEYEGVLYDGGEDTFFMMETPEIFELDGTYYLLFSDTDTRHVYYRKSTSVHGPWEKPSDKNRFAGVGIYAARTASNGNTRYIAAWTHRKGGESDYGQTLWGGNLVAHELYKKDNGDLAVKIPQSVLSYLDSEEISIKIFEEYGNVITDQSSDKNFVLNASGEDDFSSVTFNPLESTRYKISTTINYSASQNDFGFLFGACDVTNDFFSLRFIPNQNIISLETRSRDDIDNPFRAYNDVPINISPGENYDINIVVENSIVVVYVNDKVALSSRVYKANGTHWGIYSDNSDVTFENFKVTTP